MEAIAGLGNPGGEYARTRHNAGWMLLDELIRRGQALETRTREHAEMTRLKLGPDTVWLVRSTTYMNRSGLGLEQACRSLQVGPREVLVAYDDIDLPLGRLRLRRSGGSGGHRGLESVIGALGTSRIPRLRLGIRGEEGFDEGADTADYVLDEFTAEERVVAEEMIDRAADAVRMILRRGLGAAMNTYNRKDTSQ